MAQATIALAEAEEASAEHLRAAQRDPSLAHQSKIYPPGAEYALCQCLSQLLGAILGILTESWLQGLQGLNKLRKAYLTLRSLAAVEAKYFAAHPPPAPAQQSENECEDGSDDGFVGAEEHIHNGSIRTKSVAASVRSGGRRSNNTDNLEDIDFRTVTNHPIDLFIHSGMNMPWGIIQIVLSLVPPALRHVLSMFNFAGERDAGMRLLWDASSYNDNIFGAIAGLVILLYNNIAISLADIVLQDAVPHVRLEALLADLRKRYPDSQLWVTEEARIAVNNRDLTKALQLIDQPAGPSFPEMQGLRSFEKALDLLFLHHFEECIECWLQTIEMNSWSHGMYYYIAASCHIELYRDYKENDPTKAKFHAEKAKELLKPVPVLVSKGALLGKPLPFDAFIATKLKKWEARARARNADLVDVVGIPPVEELAYFWTGYRRMNSSELQVSLDRMAECEASPQWASETADEKAGLGLLQAIALRNQGKVAEAKVKLEEEVLCYSSQQIKSNSHPNTYPLPVAHYEMAACLWQENGGENAELPILREVKEGVDKSYRWEHYDMEDRMVVKLSAAKETLARLGV